MTVENLEPPSWLDDDTIEDHDWDIDVNTLQDVHTETTEHDAERHLYELAHLRGQPIERGTRTATQTIRDELGIWRAQRLADAGYPDLDDFLAQPDPEYDWLIPNLIERGDRVILTGQEGKGKSTLLRQIGVQVAAGLHPFTLDTITPRRVTLLDLENATRHVRRQLRPLRLSAGPRLTRGFFTPVIWPAGIDLLRPADRTQLIELIELTTPDLLIVGPSYKLAGGDPTAEETAKAVTSVLDELRERHGFALILEAHQPYAAPGTTRRVERPYGASLWSRWPEFGIHLADVGALRHWRGARDEREWPEALTRGGAWPWTALTDARGVAFARILDETQAAGKELSRRELEDILGVGHSTIQRVIEANRKQYDAVLANLHGGVA